MRDPIWKPTDSKSVAPPSTLTMSVIYVYKAKNMDGKVSFVSLFSTISWLLVTDRQQQSSLEGDSAQNLSGILFIWIGKGASSAVSQSTSRCQFDTDHNPAIDLNNRSQPLFWYGWIKVLEICYLQFHDTPMIDRGHKCLCLDEEWLYTISTSPMA